MCREIYAPTLVLSLADDSIKIPLTSFANASPSALVTRLHDQLRRILRTCDNHMQSLPFTIQIQLLPHHDTRHLFRSAKVENLFMHNLDHLKRLSVGDRVDEDIAMYADGVFRREERVFVLSVSSYVPCV